MKLELSYGSMSAVPDEFKDAFTEQDGKAVLSKSIEVKTEADVKAVLDAKEHVKTELADAKEKLKAFDNVDPAKFKEYENELDILRAKVKEGGTDEETINAIVQAKLERATEQMTAENSELKAKLEEEQGFRFNTERKELLSNALKDKVDPAFVGDVLDLLSGKIERGANGEWMTTESSGYDKGLGVDDLVTKFVSEKTHFAPRNSGGNAVGGARQSTSNNPFSKEGWNVTEQHNLYNNDPAKAQQLKESAG